jgi:hypothetical protein
MGHWDGWQAQALASREDPYLVSRCALMASKVSKRAVTAASYAPCSDGDET